MPHFLFRLSYDRDACGWPTAFILVVLMKEKVDSARKHFLVTESSRWPRVVWLEDFEVYFTKRVWVGTPPPYQRPCCSAQGWLPGPHLASGISAACDSVHTSVVPFRLPCHTPASSSRFLSSAPSEFPFLSSNHSLREHVLDSSVLIPLHTAFTLTEWSLLFPCFKLLNNS